MCYRGIGNWPPVWTQTSEDGVKTLRGEFGILEYVLANPNASDKCFLVMRHEGERYIGCLIFSDQAFCRDIANILRTQIGRSIRAVGDLDVGETL